MAPLDSGVLVEIECHHVAEAVVLAGARRHDTLVHPHRRPSRRKPKDDVRIAADCREKDLRGAFRESVVVGEGFPVHVGGLGHLACETRSSPSQVRCRNLKSLGENDQIRVIAGREFPLPISEPEDSRGNLGRQRNDQLERESRQLDHVLHGPAHRQDAAGKRSVSKAGRAVGNGDLVLVESVLAIRHSACAYGIGDERDAMRHRQRGNPQDGRMDVDAVGDQLRGRTDGRQRRPDRARLAMIQPGHGVEEMREMRRSPRERGNTVGVIGGGVSDGKENAIAEMLDERTDAVDLRRDRHNPAQLRCLGQQCGKLVDVGGTDRRDILRSGTRRR